LLLENAVTFGLWKLGQLALSQISGTLVWN
jgi:hypothetical protein